MAAAPSALPAAVRGRIFVYLGVLMVLLAFGAPSGGMIDIPISFLLKNKLHLTAHQVATFRLWTSLPLYLSFVFGFFRDVWNPLGMRDRGFMLLFGAASTVTYLVFAFTPVSYASLLAALLLLTSAVLFIVSAQSGLGCKLGQQHAMSGQMSTIWNIFGALPGIVALLAGGSLSGWLEQGDPDRAVRILFLGGAAIMAAVTGYALWKPAAVFGNVHVEVRDSRPLADLRRLVWHRPLYPALLIWMLWNFAPGSSTPLQYFIQNALHGSDDRWGQWNALFAAAFIPTFLLYGVLCRTVPLRKLLWWGTIVAVPQMVPLLFIHSVQGALLAAVPMGLLGGVATAAYLDLIIRSSPPGLQGTTLMLAASLNAIAVRFGDVLGTNLYDHSGSFAACVVAITVVYALILPTLLLVPNHLTATADGQVPVAATGSA